MEIKIGTIVKATAGRDAGKLFVVISILDDYAIIANGKSRKLEKPKNKKIKHLKYVCEGESANDQLTDAKLRKTIGRYTKDLIENQAE